MCTSLQGQPPGQNQYNRQNMTQWSNNLPPLKSKNLGLMNPRCGSGRGNFRSNPMMNPDMMNHSSGGPPPAGMNMPPRIPMWNQQVCKEMVFCVNNYKTSDFTNIYIT